MSSCQKTVNVVVEHFRDHPVPLQGKQMHYIPISKTSVSPEHRELLEGIETLDTDFADTNLTTRHNFIVLLNLGCGEVDVCHDLVTPLSWPSPTPFSGPPIPNSPAAANATYAHALVHRMEGSNQGENGCGFDNSCYWFSRVPSSHLVLTKLHKQYPQGTFGSDLNDLCEQALKAGNKVQIEQCEQLAFAEWHALLLHSLSLTSTASL